MAEQKAGTTGNSVAEYLRRVDELGIKTDYVDPRPAFEAANKAQLKAIADKVLASMMAIDPNRAAELQKQMAELESKANAPEPKPIKYYASLPIPWTDLTTQIDKKDLLEEDRFVEHHHVSLHVLLPEIWIPWGLVPSQPLDIELTELGCFENEGRDVLFAKVRVTPELLRLHKLFVDHHKIPWQHPEYTPHVTIAFLKPKTAKKYVESIKWQGASFKVSRIEWREHGGENKLRDYLRWGKFSLELPEKTNPVPFWDRPERLTIDWKVMKEKLKELDWIPDAVRARCMDCQTDKNKATKHIDNLCTACLNRLWNCKEWRVDQDQGGESIKDYLSKTQPPKTEMTDWMERSFIQTANKMVQEAGLDEKGAAAFKEAIGVAATEKNAKKKRNQSKRQKKEQATKSKTWEFSEGCEGSRTV